MIILDSLIIESYPFTNKYDMYVLHAITNNDNLIHVASSTKLHNIENLKKFLIDNKIDSIDCWNKLNTTIRIKFISTFCTTNPIFE